MFVAIPIFHHNYAVASRKHISEPIEDRKSLHSVKEDTYS